MRDEILTALKLALKDPLILGWIALCAAVAVLSLIFLD